MQLYDLSLFNTLALNFAYQEFKTKLLSGPHPQFYNKDSCLPVISSECPGWVCYAEKRCAELSLPHMSAVKSGQQLFGSLIRMIELNSKVVTIMPCYDKKLEAVRPNFKFAEPPVKEVDTVLATHELIELFDKLQIKFEDIQPCMPEDEEMKELDPEIEFLNNARNPKMLNIDTLFGRTSNGYLEYVFRRAAMELYKVEIPNNQPLQYKQGKNRHYQEVTYPAVDLKFVQAYGF